MLRQATKPIPFHRDGLSDVFEPAQLSAEPSDLVAGLLDQGLVLGPSPAQFRPKLLLFVDEPAQCPLERTNSLHAPPAVPRHLSEIRPKDLEFRRNVGILGDSSRGLMKKRDRRMLTRSRWRRHRALPGFEQDIQSIAVLMVQGGWGQDIRPVEDWNLASCGSG